MEVSNTLIAALREYRDAALDRPRPIGVIQYVKDWRQKEQRFVDALNNLLAAIMAEPNDAWD